MVRLQKITFRLIRPFGTPCVAKKKVVLTFLSLHTKILATEFLMITNINVVRYNWNKYKIIFRLCEQNLKELVYCSKYGNYLTKSMNETIILWILSASNIKYERGLPHSHHSNHKLRPTKRIRVTCLYNLIHGDWSDASPSLVLMNLLRGIWNVWYYVCRFPNITLICLPEKIFFWVSAHTFLFGINQFNCISKRINLLNSKSHDRFFLTNETIYFL